MPFEGGKIADLIKRDGIDSLRIEGPRMIGQALSEFGRSKSVEFLAKSLADGLFPPDVMKAVHEEVGRKAIVSAAQAYTHRRGRNKLKPYRVGDPYRNAGGKLNRALRSNRNVKAGPRTLSLYDKRFMDEQAAQWWRINFGAGGIGAGSNNPQTYPLRTAKGATLLTLAITGRTSRPFQLPPGVFIGADGSRVPRGDAPPGSNPFYFAGGQAPPAGFGRGSMGKERLTRGITATNFLDAAARRLSVELGPAYDRVASDAVRRKTPGAPRRYTAVFRPR